MCRSAHADEDGFFVDLTEYGYYGVPQQATLDASYENTGDAIDVADATFLYKAAILNLC